MVDINAFAAFLETMLKPAVYNVSNTVFVVTLAVVAVFSIFFYIVAFDGLIRRKKAPVPDFGEVKNWPNVTVQLPTFNEPVALRCAERCLQFDYPADKFNIIIGDDSNRPEFSRLIDDFAAKHADKVTVTRRGNNAGFKAGNLNHMLKVGNNGDIIVIFDSDFMPSKDFLKRIVKPFVDKKVAGVQARWQFVNPGQNLISSLASSILYMYHHLVMTAFNNHNISLVCGSAEAVRKSALQELGGWQTGSLTEDTEFSLRCIKNGYRVAYLHDLEANGEVPFTVKGFKRQQMRWGYGTTSAYLKHSKGLLKSKHFGIRQKIFMSFIMFGYVTSPLLALLFLSGILAFVTNAPAPVDFAKFFISFGTNMVLISGFMFAAIVSLHKEGKLKLAPSLAISSLTVGIFTSFYIAKAFFKAVLKKPMEWHIIQKEGNNKFFDMAHSSIAYK
jgi:cellulose synthase/poly-beta-1,6-N-acetylglucosamine synthase-like glycosyltransferase